MAGLNNIVRLNFSDARNAVREEPFELFADAEAEIDRLEVELEVEQCRTVLLEKWL